MAKPFTTVAVMGLMALAGACVSADMSGSTAVTWRKDGVDAEGMRREFGLCGGNFGSLGLPIFHPSEFEALNNCMQAKGFTLVDL